jgi:hypothetical protein
MEAARRRLASGLWRWQYEWVGETGVFTALGVPAAAQENSRQTSSSVLDGRSNEGSTEGYRGPCSKALRVQLTEDGSGGIVTGETGLAHTRTRRLNVSITNRAMHGS